MCTLFFHSVSSRAGAQHGVVDLLSLIKMSYSRCTVVAVMLTMPSTTALQPGGRVAASHPRRPLRIAMLEPPFELPYVVPRQPKPFSDYEWDESCACTER